jgi:hypothetical protein
VSILHLWAFPHDIYRVSSQAEAPLAHASRVGMQNVAKSAVGALSQKDMVDDTVSAFGRKKRGKKDKYRKLREDRVTAGPHVPGSTTVAMVHLGGEPHFSSSTSDSSADEAAAHGEAAHDGEFSLRSHSTATGELDLELSYDMGHSADDQVRIDFGDEDEFRRIDDTHQDVSLTAHDVLDGVRYDNRSKKHRRR